MDFITFRRPASQTTAVPSRPCLQDSPERKIHRKHSPNSQPKTTCHSSEFKSPLTRPYFLGGGSFWGGTLNFHVLQVVTDRGGFTHFWSPFLGLYSPKWRSLWRSCWNCFFPNGFHSPGVVVFPSEVITHQELCLFQKCTSCWWSVSKIRRTNHKTSALPKWKELKHTVSWFIKIKI